IKERYLNQAEKVSQGLLLSALNIANQCEIQYKTSKNQRLQVEIALLKMCHISAAIQLSKMPLPKGDQATADKKKTNDGNASNGNYDVKSKEISHQPVAEDVQKIERKEISSSTQTEKPTKPKLKY